MPTTNSTELAQLASNPANLLRPNQRGGFIRFMSAVVDFAAQASGDIINLFKLPAGARVVRIACNASASHGASATIKIGDSADDDKYRAAATLTTVGYSIVNTAAAQVGAAVEGADVPYTAETTIFATIGTAALPGSGRAIYTCEYVID